MSEVKLRQLPIPADDPIRTLDCQVIKRFAARYRHKDYSVLLSRDHLLAQGPDHRWHVSVAGERAIPEWDAFVAIVHAARPGVTFCVPMPPPSQWINLDERVLHAWELDDAGLEAQWREEGLTARGTGGRGPT